MAEHVRELSGNASWHRLGTVHLATLGLSIRAVPVSVAVPFVPWDDGLLCAVAPDPALELALRGTVVAFEAGNRPLGGEPLWSVVGHGFARLVALPDPPPHLAGGDHLYALIEPERILGAEVASIAHAPALATHLARASTGIVVTR